MADGKTVKKRSVEVVCEWYGVSVADGKPPLSEILDEKWLHEQVMAAVNDEIGPRMADRTREQIAYNIKSRLFRALVDGDHKIDEAKA
jgi:hypothetical protein